MGIIKDNEMPMTAQIIKREIRTIDEKPKKNRRNSNMPIETIAWVIALLLFSFVLFLIIIKIPDIIEGEEAMALPANFTQVAAGDQAQTIDNLEINNSEPFSFPSFGKFCLPAGDGSRETKCTSGLVLIIGFIIIWKILGPTRRRWF